MCEVVYPRPLPKRRLMALDLRSSAHFFLSSFQRASNRHTPSYEEEGHEGVNWELGFAFFRGWEMGFCALGLGFMKKKTIEKREWDFNLSNTGWDCGI